MVTKYPCGVCNRAVGIKHKAIQCDVCLNWIHIKCNNVNQKVYQNLINLNNQKWFCLNCINTVAPFSSINNDNLNATMAGISLPGSQKLQINPTTNSKSFFNALNSINS